MKILPPENSATNFICPFVTDIVVSVKLTTRSINLLLIQTFGNYSAFASSSFSLIGTKEANFPFCESHCSKRFPSVIVFASTTLRHFDRRISLLAARRKETDARFRLRSNIFSRIRYTRGHATPGTDIRIISFPFFPVRCLRRLSGPVKGCAPPLAQFGRTSPSNLHLRCNDNAPETRAERDLSVSYSRSHSIDSQVSCTYIKYDT